MRIVLLYAAPSSVVWLTNRSRALPPIPFSATRNQLCGSGLGAVVSLSSENTLGHRNRLAGRPFNTFLWPER